VVRVLNFTILFFDHCDPLFHLVKIFSFIIIISLACQAILSNFFFFLDFFKHFNNKFKIFENLQ
jgi:hypothetical protein